MLVARPARLERASWDFRHCLRKVRYFGLGLAIGGMRAFCARGGFSPRHRVHSVLDMHVHMMHFPAMKLADWMASRGLDDEKMGELVQADRSSISRIRRGINSPSWDLAARIKVTTGGEVTADDFLPEMPDPAPAEARA
jgi:DNA-binding XRE family transcriptional regulator